MLYCRAGYRWPTVTGWEDAYHLVWWCTEATVDEAAETARRLERNNPIDVKRAWVEEEEVWVPGDS